MSQQMSMREQLARAWYELSPAVLDGIDLPFDEAPLGFLRRAYGRADQVLAVLAEEAA